MSKKKNAETARTMNHRLEEEISAIAASPLAQERSPQDAISARNLNDAPLMTPQEMAILSLDKDLSAILANCRDIRRLMTQIEVFISAFAADMHEIKRALGLPKNGAPL